MVTLKVSGLKQLYTHTYFLVGQTSEIKRRNILVRLTASEVFLIFTTQLYQYLSVFFFYLFSDEPDVFLPKYSQTAILHAAHFRLVVNA